MKRLSIIPLAVLAVTPFTTVTAQDSLLVKPGDRVQVTHDCSTSVRRGKTRTECRKDKGTLAAVTADSIVLSVDDRGTELGVPLPSVTLLEVSRGQKSAAGKGAGIGFLVGAGLGAGVGGVFGAALGEGVCSGGCPAAFAGIGALGGGAVGTLIGLGIGAASKSERWEEVPLDQLRVSFVPQRDGRFGLGLSVRF